MTGLFNPDNNWEAALLAFVALCGMGSLVLPVWLTQRSNAKKLNKIDTQVSNNHDENFRDEMTRGFKDISDEFRAVRIELRLIRDEALIERKERIEGDQAKEAA